jgi:hypothetical protein
MPDKGCKWNNREAYPSQALGARDSHLIQQRLGYRWATNRRRNGRGKTMLKLRNNLVLLFLSGTLCQASVGAPITAEAVPAVSPGFRAKQPVVSPGARVIDWFRKYDSIRRNAQMTRAEKIQSQQLMGKMMNPNTSASDKNAAKTLLNKQISRYAVALRGMRALPKVAETSALSSGYYNYFRDASLLFSSYKKVLDNPLAADGGKPILLKLGSRKSALESLDRTNKELDGKLRRKYGIAPYRGR